MASVSYCLALVTREGGVLAGITNTFILPLLILSGVMLPISFGPPVIQALARLDPFFYAVERRAGADGRRVRRARQFRLLLRSSPFCLRRP